MKKSDVTVVQCSPVCEMIQESEVGYGTVVRLFQNCFLGLVSRLCLPARCALPLKLSRVRCRLVTEGFGTLFLVSLVSSFEVTFVVPRGAVREWRWKRNLQVEETLRNYCACET